LLAYGLYRGGRLKPDRGVRRKLPRIVVASATMALAVAAAAAAGENLLAASEPVRIAAIVGLVAGGVILYGALAHISGAASLAELKRSFVSDETDENTTPGGGEAPVS